MSETPPTTNGSPDLRLEGILNQLLAANNARSLSRLSQIFGGELDPRRSIDDECGYPTILSALDYRNIWNRNGIAQRIVEVLPKECWQQLPTIYEDEDADEITDFELAWDQVGKGLLGESHFREEHGSPIWEYLLRADILSGIGTYGVILLGIDDARPLNEPVEGVVKFPEGPQLGADSQYFIYNAQSLPEPLLKEGQPVKTKPVETIDKEDIQRIVPTKRKLLFMRVFDESTAEVSQWENNPASPRFKMPVMYRLILDDPNGDKPVAQGGGQNTVSVHWSRIIHIADNLGSTEIAGEPRLKPVYNRVYDLEKVYGGGGEGYWRGSYNGVSWETHPQLGPDFPINIDAMRDKIEQYRNGLQRDVVSGGMTAKSIAPNVLDPTPWVKIYLEAICVRIGVPMRVFLGSERGELSSTQDDSTWNDRLMSRQVTYLTPRVIVPFVDRLVLIGVLPVPAKGYCARWPNLNVVKPSQKADFAFKITQALAAYVSGNVEAVMPLSTYLTLVVGLSDEEAKQVMEDIESAQDSERFTPDPEEQRAEDAQLAQENFDREMSLTEKTASGLSKKE